MVSGDMVVGGGCRQPHFAGKVFWSCKPFPAGGWWVVALWLVGGGRWLLSATLCREVVTEL